jgi:septal ring factor EnvC (AmiA/AmiB activator)
MNTDKKIKELEREIAQSKEANAGLMHACYYLERELDEVNEKLRQHASMLKSSDAHNNDIFCKLEKERELHSETKNKLAEVTKQRDALAEALRNYMYRHRRHGFVTPNEVLDAERALAAVKGGGNE